MIKLFSKYIETRVIYWINISNTDILWTFPGFLNKLCNLILIFCLLIHPYPFRTTIFFFFIQSYRFQSQFLLDAIKVGWVWIGISGRTPMHICFMVNPVPHDTIVATAHHTKPNCESQSAFESFSQKI